jgi:hypothetical protein
VVFRIGHVDQRDNYIRTRTGIPGEENGTRKGGWFLIGAKMSDPGVIFKQFQIFGVLNAKAATNFGHAPGIR